MIPASLTKDRVRTLWREGINRYGGDPTERPADLECFDSSIHAAVNGACYTSNDGSLNCLHVAAYLLFYLAKNHCCVDGNKRVAWMAATDYLYQEGLKVIAEQDEAAQFVLDIADDKIDKIAVIDWLAADGRLTAAE